MQRDIWNRLFGTMTMAGIMMAMAMLLVIHSTEAISCWQCNSGVDPFCKDVPSGPVDVENLHDCFKKMYKECPNELNYTICRKQVQTIEEDERVIRSCGFIRAPQDCYTTKNPPATTIVCQCDGDGCNDGAAPSASPILLAFILALPLIENLIRQFRS